MTNQALLSQIQVYRQAPGISEAQVQQLDSLQAQVESGTVDPAFASTQLKQTVAVKADTARGSGLHGAVGVHTSQLLTKPALAAINTLKRNDMAALAEVERGDMVLEARHFID